MDMRAAAEIDRAIAETVDLHYLHALETGMAPAQRKPRFIAPADQPPVDFEIGGDDERSGKRPTVPDNGPEAIARRRDRNASEYLRLEGAITRAYLFARPAELAVDEADRDEDR
ncbi:hypothetical protein KHC28_24190 [Ancylobacter sonchi]|uniref:hypothetical protein n=1 Tax=Ancylobacter sonchi TaxID=1937790 RepID=UPI001BD6AB80|nr:hypothetical protein [Ancylobacter sonchi]MBS7536749.1 hypothetical protein [Ancylobacter sonchi]